MSYFVSPPLSPRQSVLLRVKGASFACLRAIVSAELLNGTRTSCSDPQASQKVSNVSRDPKEITFCARFLATLESPVGIYFVNEDIYTLASYYQEDMREKRFFPSPDWQMLPEDDGEEWGIFLE